jgi:GWxTD domain-containing protein
VEFVNDLLQFIKNKDNFGAAYEINIAVLDINGRVKSSKSLKSKLTTNAYDETNALNRVTRHYFTFDLESGGYEIFVELIDLNTKHQLARRDIVVLNPLERGIAISNLVCMDSLVFNGLRPDLNIQNIVKKYERPKSKFSGYFEVFSATEDSIRLDYRIYNQRGEAKISYHEIVYFTDNLVRKLLPLKEYITLPGKYWIIIEARSGAQKVIIRQSFEIKYWKPSKTLAQLEFGDFGVLALRYITAPEEFNEILQADRERRELLVESFWAKRDPDPQSPENEIRAEFRNRVDYTIRNFSNTLYDRAGWDTERGRVFIIYGEPTEIQNRFLPDNPARYEIWFYKNLDRQFVFLDKKGYGLFRLIHAD